MRQRFARPNAALLALGLMAIVAAPAAADAPEIDGQVRVRESVLLNHDFDSDAEDHDNYATMRTRVGLHFAAGEHAQAYVQFQDTRALGEPASTLTSLEQVDLHQGYVDVRADTGAALALRIGRQEMNYGTQRQVGAVGWSDVGRSFDGVRMLYTIEDFGWFHAWAMKLSETGGVSTINSGAGITASSAEQAFFGGYLHYDAGEGAVIETYLFDLYRDEGNIGPDMVDATGNLFTAGLRATWRSADGDVSLYGEGAYQFGSAPDFESGGMVEQGPDYAAYAALAGIDYQLPSESVNGWIGFEFNAASGDDGSDPNEIGTYTQLFPTAHAPLGYMDFVSWTNMLGFAGTVGLKPNSQWKLWATYHSFQVMEEADAWYKLGGRLAGTRLLGDASYDSGLGSEIDISAKYSVDDNLSFLGVFGMWLPGDWQEQATSGDANNPADLDPAFSVFVQTTATF